MYEASKMWPRSIFGVTKQSTRRERAKINCFGSSSLYAVHGLTDRFVRTNNIMLARRQILRHCKLPRVCWDGDAKTGAIWLVVGQRFFPHFTEFRVNLKIRNYFIFLRVWNKVQKVDKFKQDLALRHEFQATPTYFLRLHSRSLPTVARLLFAIFYSWRFTESVSQSRQLAVVFALSCCSSAVT